ncbi:AgaE protein, conversion of agropinic acid to mannopinic acid [Sulfitobacter noctilucicola]|uniref:Glycine/D-amino acid oxidase-like deaminating enzyme n=1 Tax=Sulfitobacter noctilucicola TaxID=1342301 RepID=A0A7W6M848_9RHOB|nr:FAD-binding oxidoreductase [Sulfitobacter noctilucicola]KIN64644.1 AgaE protein, conversion of agropinic acid to mannopinic acid [Sulfitobacter noctilucicola]MBB4174206.1 glycine/D-amino acid oxidase-like deaminating enzyme [Sulfitobacter noctilucicola]
MSHPFVISESSPLTYGGPLPEQAEVVIIGGGVIGICTAIELAQLGHDVVVLEKGRIAGEQSSRNWGWIRQQGRDPDELPIMVDAIHGWKDLASRTNVDFGLRQTGVTYLAKTASDMAGYERWLPHAKAHGVDTKILNSSEAAAMLPGLSHAVAGALVTPSDMRAEPWLAVPALAGIAARAGIRLLENCAVRMLDLAAGRVAGVMTERGRIHASTVVLAGGAWSSLFLRNHGVGLPQLAVRESVVATHPLPDIHSGAAADDKVAFRRRTDGGYTLAPSGVAELYIGPDAFRALPAYLPQLRAAPFNQQYLAAAPRGFPDAWGTPRRWTEDEITPFERMRVLNPTPNSRHLSRLVRRFAALFPALPPVRVKATWAGMIDTMPDVVPVVDHCAELPGLVIGTGMSGHGFGIGPGIGQVLAGLVRGDTPRHDLSRFRANRFRDGSKIKLSPGV